MVIQPGLGKEMISMVKVRRKDLMNIVRNASGIMLSGGPPRIARKRSFTDYTTSTDIAVEDQIKRELKALYPTSLVIAEESSLDDYGCNWSASAFILDPIDGTINFFHHIGISAISLAYIEEGKLLHGIIYDPYRDEMFSATRNEGAFLNGNPIEVSSVRELKKSLAGFGTSPYSKEKGLEMLRTASRVYVNCQDLRRLGAAAVDLAYVACGRLDVFFEKDLKPWDFYAGILLISEAGGKTTNWEGSPIEGLHRQDILAGNSDLHEAMLDLIGE